MNDLRDFEQFMKEGVVVRNRIDIPRAKSLIGEAEQRKQFLNQMLAKMPLNDANANYCVESTYDTVMELIRAKLCLDGYKTSGGYAHEAEVSYLRILEFKESEIIFMNELRYFRNGITYYGKKFDADYAKKVLNFLESIYPKLRKLLDIKNK